MKSKRKKSKRVMRLSSEDLRTGIAETFDFDVGYLLEKYKRSRGISERGRVLIKWK